MAKNFRSICPVASALDVVGDKWSLLIVRDMLLEGKKTFKEIYASREGIAPNILSSRFKMLESFGIITKQKLPTNKKENIYLLTEKGIDLTPMVLEIILWSDRHLREFNPGIFDISSKGMNGDRTAVITRIQENYRNLVRETTG
jgi:DNA-binding HxlR family transcriptional regulator